MPVKLRPLLTATHRYDKSLSTRHRGQGTLIDAPILAYLIETPNGRILYDVGCDYGKILDPERRAQYYDAAVFPAPQMREEQRVPNYLARLGLSPADIDVVFVGHLHFDHAGGLWDLPGREVHVQQSELEVARSGADPGVFLDDLRAPVSWRPQLGEYEVVPGVRAVATPGHTVGHMSMWVELEQGPPVLLCGDAADLRENLEEEIAPGLLWQDDEAQALASIRKLKDLAAREKADLWPNHDIAFYETLRRFPEFYA